MGIKNSVLLSNSFKYGDSIPAEKSEYKPNHFNLGLIGGAALHVPITSNLSVEINAGAEQGFTDIVGGLDLRTLEVNAGIMYSLDSQIIN